MKFEETQPSVKQERGRGAVDTSYVDLAERRFDKTVGAPENEPSMSDAESNELADELFGVSEKPTQSPEVVADLAQRAEKIKETFGSKGNEQVASDVLEGIDPESVIVVSEEEMKAIQEAEGVGSSALEYVSDLPKMWDKPRALSVEDIEGFKTALTQKRLANEMSQKKIVKAGLLGATASLLGGVGAIAGGGAGSAMALGGGIAIIAGGGGFLIIGGLGYAGKRIFDKHKEKKAIDNFTTAHTTKTKSPGKAGLIKDYLSRLW
jgi:hypothetical protein